MHSPLHPQHHHGSRLTSTTPVCVFTRDMLRKLAPLAPPRLRRYKPFHTRRIRSALLAFTAADPTNSPPLFITALELRIHRHVASIVYARIFTFLIGISKTYAPHQHCTLPAFARRKLRCVAVMLPFLLLYLPLRTHHSPLCSPFGARFNAHHVAPDSLSGAVAGCPPFALPSPVWFIFPRYTAIFLREIRGRI
ncbi:hypothetical protein B0H19DRAFT_1263794 [Mycena capillaripes]|nr:hypothetical protein B0H19DRAFT_1263794 [Mycena capillaripes]